MMNTSAEVLLKLLRIGLGGADDMVLPADVNWKEGRPRLSRARRP